ncbi:hypothetical protein RUM43_009945 [Polyplax serrata]|uniref:Uncharacterized protein n=1 Tax=Polyplax serrata TaxID=468196 RepID=A0AAN8PV61_POLSC
MNRHLKHFSLLPSTGASQKLNLSSPHRRKRYASSDDDLGKSTGFSGAIHRNPPPMPPALLRRIGVKEVTGVGKLYQRSLSAFTHLRIFILKENSEWAFYFSQPLKSVNRSSQYEWVKWPLYQSTRKGLRKG